MSQVEVVVEIEIELHLKMRSAYFVMLALACLVSAASCVPNAEEGPHFQDLMQLDLAKMGNSFQRSLTNLISLPEGQSNSLTSRLKRGFKEDTGCDLMNLPSKMFTEMMDKLKPEETFAEMKKFVSKSVENAVRPVLKLIKELEDYVRPDGCTLQTVCSAGSSIDSAKDYLDYIPTYVYEDSSILKAMTKGIKGSKCEELFVCAASN